jgi:hypothetical protein
MNNNIRTKTIELNPPEELQFAIPETITLVESVDEGVNRLEELPSVSLSASQIVPSFKTNVLTAQRNGKYWTSTVRPQVVSAVNTVVDYDSTFNIEYENLQIASIQLNEGDVKAVENFKKILVRLQKSSRIQAELVASINEIVYDFSRIIVNDVRNFNQNEQEAEAAKEKYIIQAKQANDRILKLDQKLKKEKKKKKRLLIISPLMWTIERTIATLTGQIKEENKILENAQNDIRKAESDYNEATKASEAVKLYISAEESMSRSVMSLQNGWIILDSNLEVLIQSEDITSFNSFTIDILASVKANWENLVEHAKTIV